LEIVKCLLENNAKVDQATQSGGTPLSAAARMRHSDIYAMLTLRKNYQDQQNQPFYSQLETILLASIEIPSLITNLVKSAKSFFFSSPEQGFHQEILTALRQSSDQDINTLKSIIEQYRSHIEPVKYEFIQCYIFNDKTLELKKDTSIEMRR